MLWYLLNLSIILVFVILFLITRQTNKRWSKINDYLGMVTNTVNSVRYGNLSTKIEEINHPTYQNVTDSINRMVETLNDREKMIVEYQTELMRQNKLLESVINSLSDGILIINDKHAILRATPQISEWFGAKGQEIIGTNIFNICIVLGLPIAIFGDLVLENFNLADIVTVFLTSFLLFIFAKSERLVSKKEGIVMLGIFVAYYITMILG